MRNPISITIWGRICGEICRKKILSSFFRENCASLGVCWRILEDFGTNKIKEKFQGKLIYEALGKKIFSCSLVRKMGPAYP